MKFLDLTLPTPQENVAFDESLILLAEQGQVPETLRLWDARQTFVVLGRGSKANAEVQLTRAERDDVPVIRRFTGGATVLAAKGCMFYSVLLSVKERPSLQMLDTTHQFVMGRIVDAIKEFEPQAELDGTCDLVLRGRKASGNALRVTRDWVLYHGTLLLNMNLSLISEYLKHPPREPKYRAGRAHDAFLTNLEIKRDAVAEALQKQWKANGSYELNGLLESTKRLVEEKYSQGSWNLSR